MLTDYLHEFIDLSGTLSFTRSAANLHMTQPTLSRHIAELEEQVGTPLFHRTTKSMELTNAGKAFYEKAVALVKDYEGMFASALKASERIMVPITVGGSTVQPTVNRLFTKMAARAVALDLPIRLRYAKTRSFTGEAPSLNAIDLLHDGDADLIVEPLNSKSENFKNTESFKICDEKLFVFVSSENPLAQRHNLRLEDLRDNMLVTYAVYRHCPFLMSEPFYEAGYDRSRQKTFFIGNLLEIPEHLAALGPHEFVALQKGFCESFGFGQDGLGTTALLDIKDERAKIAFYALYRKNETSPHVAAAVRLLEDILDEYRAGAAPEDLTTEGGLWSSALYRFENQNSAG